MNAGSDRKMVHVSSERLSWKAMRARCRYAAHARYAYYGGRGIKVCDRWDKSFDAFLEDMGPKPSPQHTIDRYPNKDGNYEPGNCRWATRKEQARNTRRARLVTVGEETMSVVEWAERTGHSEATIRRRLELGWSAKDVVGLGVPKRSPLVGRLPSSVRSARRRLSVEQIAEVRTMCNAGDSQAAVARRFGISAPYVSQLMAGARRAAGESMAAS